MNINFRGHQMGEESVERVLNSEIRIWKSTTSGMSKPDEIFAVLFDHPIHTSHDCWNCGEEIGFSTTDKGENFFAESECPYKDGFPPIEVNLEVPSGEILLFNDLRSCYKNDEDYDVNSKLGIKLQTEYYAKQGMITHFVGNSCPRVVQVSNERLDIGNYEEDENIKVIGTICTDLWWYCAVDRANFEKQIGKTTEQYEKEYHERGYWPDVIRAKVIPGTYRTVGQYHIDDKLLYSFIERIK